jgi:UDP-3-O-[3-hydroxymyristoyl] glucosamine N-acyltransferase
VVHPTCVLGQDVLLAPRTWVGPFVVLGDRVRLGEGVKVHASSCLGDDVEVGADSVLDHGVVVHDGVIIGARAHIESGAVIGSDGFGYVPDRGVHHKIPQVGTVRLGDDVRVGANVCIDRATTGCTTIGDAVTLGALTHLGHNVQVGRGSVLEAQVGIAGSTTVGEDSHLEVGAGTSPHLHIGSRVHVHVRGAITKDTGDDVELSGYPARPLAETERIQRALGELDALGARVTALEAAVAS